MTSAVSTARVMEERSILVSFNPKLSPFAAYRSRCAILFGEGVHAVLGVLDGLASVDPSSSPDSRLRFHPRTRKDTVLFRRRWRPSHPCGTQPRPQHTSAPAQGYPTPQRRALWPKPQAAEESPEAQVSTSLEITRLKPVVIWFNLMCAQSNHALPLFAQTHALPPQVISET